MGILQTGSNGCAGVASSVHDVPPVVVLSLVQKRLNSGLGKAPGTSVKGFLLAPDDVLRVGVRVKVLLKVLPWEGVELFDAGNGNVLQATRLTFLDKCGVDLTSTENNTIDLLVRADLATGMGWVLDDPLEVRVTSKLLNVGAGQRVSEKRLGEEENEGLAELAVHLATQQVEVVGWLGAVSNLDVAVLVLAVKLIGRREDAGVLINKLQVSLHTSRGVLWSLAVISVGQAHYESRTLEPFDLTRCDKLVDDDLRGVCKVTKLCFPHDKSVRR